MAKKRHEKNWAHFSCLSSKKSGGRKWRNWYRIHVVRIPHSSASSFVVKLTNDTHTAIITWILMTPMDPYALRTAATTAQDCACAFIQWPMYIRVPMASKRRWKQPNAISWEKHWHKWTLSEKLLRWSLECKTKKKIFFWGLHQHF